MSGPVEPGLGHPDPSLLPDHPRARLSLVLGIVAMLGCVVLCPVAWWVGQRTLAEIDAEPHRWGGRASAQAGCWLGALGTVLLGLLLLLVGALVLVATGL